MILPGCEDPLDRVVPLAEFVVVVRNGFSRHTVENSTPPEYALACLI
jgi:hypothetical protein